jgi:hypothetical protein
VNALVLVAKYPGHVGTLVAHEPPALRELPDSGPATAAVEDMRKTYLREGFGPGMAKFIAFVSHTGPVTEDYVRQPPPDPGTFGLPGADDGSRDDPLLGQNLLSCTYYTHDFDALRAASTRVVIGVGEDSREAVAGRAGAAVARRLGTDPVVFPGGHDGFLGGEYGRSGKSDAFAAILRTTLAG